MGLTLPGMMLEPGSLAGRESSPKPQRGPDPSHLTSFAIFIREAARVFRAPEAATSASWAANWANLFSALTNPRPVFSAIWPATVSANSGWVLRPVPTAVPPSASSSRSPIALSTRLMAASSIETYPLNSCPRVSGTASMRWVLPILTMLLKSLDLLAKALRK